MDSYRNLTLNWLYLDINSYFATVEQHHGCISLNPRSLIHWHSINGI